MSRSLISPIELYRRFGITPFSCPFCGSYKAVMDGPAAPHIHCLDCLCDGPMLPGGDQTPLEVRMAFALEAWNRRAVRS